MSIPVTIDGLDYDVEVTMIDSPSDIDPETYMALRGLKGDKGDTGSAGQDGSDGSNGVGITSITQNLDGTLTISLDDGTSYDTDPVKGDKGDTGDTGNGIASVVKTSTTGLVDTYTITYTDGTTTTFEVTNGQDGQNGQDGHSPIITATKVDDTTTIYVDGVATGTIVDGQDGQDGQDGHSPTITASKVGKVTTVYVDGSSVATINDGNDGERGSDGDDGFSPTATVSKSGDTATITITDKDGTTTASVTDGDDAQQGLLYYGQVDNTSTATAFTAQIDGITEYVDGLTVVLKNGVVTSASGFTININGLGAKHAYSNMAAATAETTLFNVNYTMIFIYDSTRVEGGGWILYRGYNSNDNTIGYQLRGNSGLLTSADKFRYYRLLFTSADGTQWVPANNGTDNSATSAKTVNQRPINPFGRIVYFASTSSISAGSNVTAASAWDQYILSLGYSFNRTGSALTLTIKRPVYVKCAPQSDGSAIIDATEPIVQALPSTEDGKIYIYLGIAYSTSNIELVQHHPIYEYKSGAIRLFTNGASGGSYTETDPTVPSWAKEPTKPTYTASEVGALPDDTVIPTKVSDLTNDSGYITGYTETDPIFLASAAHGISASDISAWNGKLEVTSFDALSSGAILGTEYDIGTTSYTDQLYNRDAIDGMFNTALGSLATVATSGSYNDLSNKPTIPTVNNATLTIQKNGTTVKTFTANASSNVTANITVPTKVSDLTNDSGFITGYTETDPTVPSWAKASSKPSYTASEVGALPDTTVIPSKVSDLTNDSGFITGMTILSYGSSTWNDFITAYNANKVVYCRASSNSNPASGSQTRLAFMAYVNNASSPTEVEFQYYRSISSHSASQQGDQVFVYKLTSAGTWTVTTREASTKIVASTGLQQSYSNGALTISLGASIPSKTSDLTNDSGFISSESDPVFTASDAYGISSSDIGNWDDAYDGNISFDTSAQSGDDYDLTTILTTLGWLNDVIV